MDRTLSRVLADADANHDMSELSELVSLRETIGDDEWVIIANPDRPNEWLGMIAERTVTVADAE